MPKCLCNGSLLGYRRNVVVGFVVARTVVLYDCEVRPASSYDLYHSQAPLTSIFGYESMGYQPLNPR